MHKTARCSKRILPRPGALLAAALLAAAPFLCGGAAKAQAVASGSVEATAATMAAGTAVTATLLSQPPTLGADQMAAFQAAFAQSHRSGPTDLPVATPAADGTAGPPQPRNASAATDMFITTNPVVPGGGFLSGVGEPSGDSSAHNIFQTGNWYATMSADYGNTFSYVDPFTLFGPGFCCDQVAIYDPGRDWWFWLLQFNDHLVLANSGDLVHWCFYTWTPANFGFTGSLDYNDLAVTTNNIYIVSNIFPSAGGMGSTIARLPIDPQVGCAGFNYNSFTRTDLGFTWKPVSGATDVLYWGTNWWGTFGSSFRVFKWAENSGTVAWFDRTLGTTFTFYTRNSGQNCGSTDGVVKNWCQFSDSRVLGGARYSDPDGVARLIFSFNAKQGGPFGLPFPYSERVHFRESDFGYIGSDRLWSGNDAFQYTSLATDARGHVGMTTIFGGGTGGADDFPSGEVLLNDDVAPNQPWNGMINAYGAGNPCTAGGLYRYGDYMTTRPYRPTNLAFMGFNYVPTADAGDCGSNAPVQPYETVFGRMRDYPGFYLRWY